MAKVKHLTTQVEDLKAKNTDLEKQVCPADVMGAIWPSRCIIGLISVLEVGGFEASRWP